MISLILLLFSVALNGLIANAATGTIQDVEHVVLFMQENRAFDHYFGTMAGVRGFGDPNVHVASTGRPVWFQQVNSSISTATTALLPWYINAAGGTTSQSSQCMNAGSNGWQANHAAFNGGNNDLWAIKNTPFSWGYYKRADLPQHFGIAEGWTMADMYSQSVVASTIPNRAFWASGSINVPGGPQNASQGGTTIDNNETPGCEETGISCFPLGWKTFAEFLEDAGVSWQVFQDPDNFGDNPFAWFSQFQNATEGSVLQQKGLTFLGFSAFFARAANGTLPQVSYLIGPGELSEHPPNTPHSGAWLQQQIVNAVTSSPKYNSTALMISYDETGGWGDHVLPITSPKDTPGEWMADPFVAGTTSFAGPGFRLPFYVISPWTRGGHVFTEHSDHSSQFMFLEQWLASKGFSVKTDQLNSWRREHMSDLTKMFDFAHPDLSIPNIPAAPKPHMDSQGVATTTSDCQAKFPNPQPVVPFGKQTRQNSLTIENGFKSLRGLLTEGRFLVFETAGRGLTLTSSGLTTKATVAQHNDTAQRFVLTSQADPPASLFTIRSAANSTLFVSPTLTAVAKPRAATFEIDDLGAGQGYTLKETSSGMFVALGSSGVILSLTPAKFNLFSVTMSTDSGTGFV